MRKRSWQVALAVIALIATATALYVQLSAWRARQEAEQRAAARLVEAMAESGRGAAATVQGRTEPPSGDPPDNQPLPDAVLRRGESGGGSTFQHVRDTQDEQAAALARLQERLDILALQMERSDQALRRDLETLQAQARQEQDTSSKTLLLLLVALIPLVALSLRS